VVSHHTCEQLQRPPVDVLMTGHLHDSSASALGTVLVRAGTATSTRTRDEPNSFNVLRLSHGRIEVEEQQFNGSAFVAGECRIFVRNGDRWIDGHQ
jgi:predicted phosphodiesterase